MYFILTFKLITTNNNFKQKNKMISKVNGINHKLLDSKDHDLKHIVVYFQTKTC